MSTSIYKKYSTTETTDDDFTEYDKRMLSIVEELVTESLEGDTKGKAYKGTAVRHLTEDESINNIGASIAYAFNKKTEEWTNISLSTWVSDVIFAPYYVEMPSDLKKKDKKGFGVKETSPAVLHIRANSPFEFDEDKSPMIVCDWEGNFKKGTFTMSHTWILKKKGNFLGRFIGGLFTFGAMWYVPLSETAYKKIIHFDGATSDWGNSTMSAISWIQVKMINNMRSLFIILCSFFCFQTTKAIDVDKRTSVALGYIQRGYIQYGFEELKKIAATNDLAAQFYVGVCYEHGIGVEKDPAEAFRMYRKAAERGLPDAMYNILLSIGTALV